MFADQSEYKVIVLILVLDNTVRNIDKFEMYRNENKTRKKKTRSKRSRSKSTTKIQRELDRQRKIGATPIIKRNGKICFRRRDLSANSSYYSA